MALHQEKGYTIEDIYALSDGQRAELIDGQIFKSKNGDCEIYPAQSYDGGIGFTHEDHVFHACVMLNLKNIGFHHFFSI